MKMDLRPYIALIVHIERWMFLLDGDSREPFYQSLIWSCRRFLRFFLDWEAGELLSASFSANRSIYRLVGLLAEI